MTRNDDHTVNLSASLIGENEASWLILSTHERAYSMAKMLLPNAPGPTVLRVARGIEEGITAETVLWVLEEKRRLIPESGIGFEIGGGL